jgi:hypothetical protein
MYHEGVDRKFKSRQARWYTTVIPAIPQTEIGRIQVQGQQRQKVRRSISTKNLGMMEPTCHPSHAGKHK